MQTPPAASAEPTTAEPASGEPAWVLQGFDGRRTVIDVVAEDGTGRHTLTENLPGSFQTNPDWSPDGSQLTFVVTGADGRDDLWVVDADGTDARMVFDCEDSCDMLDDPAWSPDGEVIAACKFTATTEGHFGTLVAVDVESGTESVLFTPEGTEFCAGPRWSPDGTQIVLELVHRLGVELEFDYSGVTLTIVDLETDPPTLTPLTDPALFAATADWSRSTDLIVYSGRLDADTEENDLFTVSPEGGEPTRLTRLAEAGGSAFEPSFDSDGRTVVFVHGDGSLWRVDPATGEVGPAFTDRVSGNHPRSRPR